MVAFTQTRRVTPTAVRVLPADALRDEWLARRREGIGSSDVAAILGVADKATALHVYRDKRGELVDEDNEYALWGRVLEEPVAREWQRRNRSVVHRVGLVANVNTPWALATLDRRVMQCPLDPDGRNNTCALEVKCRNVHVAYRWRADVPDDVLAQVTWQMEVTGYDHIHVAVLIGGNDYRQTTVRRDLHVAAYMCGEVKRFRDEHLLPGVPPPHDPTKADAVIEMDKLMHRDDRGGVLEADLDAMGELMAYVDAQADEAEAKRRKKAAQAAMAIAADGHEYVKFGDELAWSYRPGRHRSVDLDTLAERYPDAYAACVTDKPTSTLVIAPAQKRPGRSS